MLSFNMMGSFIRFLLPTPYSDETNITQKYDTKLWPLLIILSKTQKDGHDPTAGPRTRTTSLTTALTCAFMTDCNTLSQPITEHPEIQYAAKLTIDIAQETHILLNTFGCHKRALTLTSLVQIGD